MSREDKDIFDLMNNLSEEESMELLEGLMFEEEELGEEQRSRIKVNVLNKLGKASVKTRRTPKKGIIAAAVAALIIFAGFTPSGQRAVAEIIERLYFIPGIGSVQENKGHDIYVLQKPIYITYGTAQVTVKAVVRDDNTLSIKLDGGRESEVSDFRKLMIVDQNGKQYTNSSSSIGSGGLWTGNYWFESIPENMNSFKLLLSNQQAVNVELSKAQGFEDYYAMGPTDVKNNVGITMVSTQEDGKVKLNLISHPLKGRRIESYGQPISLTNEANKLDIALRDEAGRQYELENRKQYSPPLSEFYFKPNEKSKNYVLEIPEISLNYKINKSIKLPIPSEGELEVNKNFTINNFTLSVKKVVRTGNQIRVYVDTNYDSSRPENLSELKIGGINHSGSFGYGWKTREDNRTVEYYEFEVKEKDKSITIKFSEFDTILKGPWKFEFIAQ